MSRPKILEFAIVYPGACKSRPYFFSGQPRHSNHFIATALARRNTNGGAGYIQNFRKEFNAGIVGPSIKRRGGQSDFQRISKLAGDGILLGTRMDLDRECRTSLDCRGWESCEKQYPNQLGSCTKNPRAHPHAG